ncbi:hypothetical protein ADUPG1_001629, partial [Aduncisulcus paluster]
KKMLKICSSISCVGSIRDRLLALLGTLPAFSLPDPTMVYQCVAFITTGVSYHDAPSTEQFEKRMKYLELVCSQSVGVLGEGSEDLFIPFSSRLTISDEIIGVVNSELRYFKDNFGISSMKWLVKCIKHIIGIESLADMVKKICGPAITFMIMKEFM